LTSAPDPDAVRLAHVCSSDLSIPALMPFCRPLLARGWRIAMITPPGPHARGRLPPGMSWLPFALQRRIHPASDVVGTLQLARYFRRERFDIVHTHNIKAIIVHTIHGMAYSLDTPPLRRAAHATLERVANLRCDLVFSQSQEDRDTVVATEVIAPDKVIVIGNGIDLHRFRPDSPDAIPARRTELRRELAIAPDDIVFLSAGRLIVEKGFLELFAAAASARRTDSRIRLVVAGAVDERADTLDQAVLADARRQGVILLGRRDDMPALYAASDVVVLASWHEGMPRVLMEGAAMGKPLLATDVRGCREVVQHERNGLLVPPRDPEALAAAMLALAADAALRAELGHKNAIEAGERYAIERSIGIVNDAYARLLARRRSK
jgi:glycosyltransferase involved in cell wall biosynthesis